MNFETNNVNSDHRVMVSQLIKSGQQIQEELTEFKCRLLHAVLGISGEAGEILDNVKKHVIYNNPLDFQNALEELGDMEFYLQELRAALNITREETLRHNLEKLKKRYPGFNYSDKSAIERKDKAITAEPNAP